MKHTDLNDLRNKIGLAKEALKEGDVIALSSGAPGRHYKTLTDALDAAQCYVSDAYRIARRVELEEETR